MVKNLCSATSSYIKPRAAKNYKGTVAQDFFDEKNLKNDLEIF